MHVLHLFRPSLPSTMKKKTMYTSAAGSLCDGDTRHILLHFLQRRGELSMPIESIVCSPTRLSKTHSWN